MVGFRTRPACGDFAHHDLCKPALAAMLADEKAEHDLDNRRLTKQLAELKQELQDERQRHA